MSVNGGEGVDDGRGDSDAKVGLTPRSYQLEMLEESMRRNIIIAMDTGSGKTLIAILRIQAELERCAMEKIVWFCVPTVALAEQQYRAISAQLPAYQARVLSGKDNCEFWVNKTWTEVLTGTRICVSTHDILLHALIHGFVKMEQIALLIFDEAHKATKNHPANKIMQCFYHPAPSEFQPSILGLTASPLINNQIHKLDVLESNLNAISRTPKLHRLELLKFVHLPKLVQVMYRTYNRGEIPSTTALLSLWNKYEFYDLNRDPWIIRMNAEADPQSSKSLMKAIAKKKTWCRDQLRDLFGKAKIIALALGPWAADLYIHQCIQKLRTAEVESFAIEDTIYDQEKLYLQELLDSDANFGPSQENLHLTDDLISPKAKVLIDFLKEEEAATFSGLVFVQTRAEVAILSQLLTVHPSTKSFVVGTFVGESNYSNRKFALGELADIRNQKTALDDLRHGKTNLIVTTNALEEGIDVSACNVVVCFEKPPNLKSFIQRRGRARKEASTYAILLDETETQNATLKWQELEDLMKNLYADDMRQLQKLQQLEDEETEEKREIYVERTGAKMGLAEAVSHLYHFCDRLAADRYVSRTPMFFYEADPDHSDRISARVLLPSCVDASLREASSKHWWKTEQNARRDAAFEAYVALYQAGLVNDNLLPSDVADTKDGYEFTKIEKRPNFAEVDQQINMWPCIAERWESATGINQVTITASRAGQTEYELNMLLPFDLPNIESLKLHWDMDLPHEITFRRSIQAFPMKSLQIAKEITHLLMSSVFRTRMSGQKDFIALFVPAILCHDPSQLKVWLDQNSGSTNTMTTDGMEGLIRDMNHDRAAYIFRRLLLMRHQEALALDIRITGLEQAPDAQYRLLEVKKLPRKLDLLHETAKQDKSKQGPGTRYLHADSCEMDRLPWSNAIFASFMPSILHIIHKTLLVDQLCTKLLGSLEFEDRALITAAISATSARESSNYQRLEFLGDSILKLLTSMTLMAKHLIYDEGRLSHRKDHIVSNGSLSSAAIKLGLAPFIITKSFTGKKWRPIHVSTVLAESRDGGRREMSTKTLADVVESLIGAAFQDGGYRKAIQSLKIFLPDVDWTLATEAHAILIKSYDRSMQPVPPSLLQTENLIGHVFTRKQLILEAITHASYQGIGNSQSYQRLEFLGDPILDNIVTTSAFHHEPPIPVHRLHLIRTALVNGPFLGYLCMRLSTTLTRTEVKPTGPKTVETFTSEPVFALWQVMRHSNTAITADQRACLARYNELNDKIAAVLAEGKHYPWTMLARLEPPKLFSDMIESIVAAIWIDSHGSLAESTAFLERLGLMSYLKRLLETEDLALLHPKEELGQLADTDRVKYKTTVGEDEVGRKRLTCRVNVGEREIVEVGDGLTSMEVETRAADEACKALRREGRRLGKRKDWRDGVERGEGGGEGDGREEEEEEKEGEENDSEEGGRVDATKDSANEPDLGSGAKGKRRNIDDDRIDGVDKVMDDGDDKESEMEYLSAEE